MTSSTRTPENPRIIALFDVDGTLTIPRGEITEEMMDFMKALGKKITGTCMIACWLRCHVLSLLHSLSHVYSRTIVGIVGGSDLPKQEEQLGAGVVDMFPYNFSQNGLVAYKNGKILEVQTIAKFLGEDNIKRIVNWVLKYLADVDIPVKVRMYVSTCT